MLLVLTGNLSEHPAVENTFFVILYGPSAIGTLLAPYALMNFGGKAARIAGTCTVAAGIMFLVFSAMNYYTHMGMLTNIKNGTSHRW